MQRDSMLRYLWILVAGVTACSDSDPPSAVLPPRGYGVVEGRIWDAGGPVEANVSFFEASTQRGAPAYQIRVSTDSTGAFFAPVPYGTYFLRVNAPGGVGFWYGRHGLKPSPGDSLRVSPGAERVRVDFRLGCLRLRIPIPPGWPEWNQPGVLLEQPFEEPLQNEPQVYARKTDDHFEAVIRGLPEGRYLARVEFRWRVVYLPYGTDRSGADRIVVSAGRWTEGEYDLPSPVTVRGRVRGSWLELARRMGAWDQPQVLLYADDSTSVAQVAPWVTDGGDYSETLLFHGFVRVGVSLSGMVHWIGGDNFREATRFELPEGTEVTFPDVVEGGVIFHLEGGADRPVQSSYFTLSVHDAAGNLLGSNAGGWYSGNILAVSNLRPGRYLFRLTKADHCRSLWLSTWYPGVEPVGSALPVRIDDGGQVLELVWPVPPGGEITWVLEGVGTSGSGSYAAKLLAASDSTIVACGLVEQTGGERAFVRGLPDGDYALAVYEYRGGRWWKSWYPGVARHGDAEQIVLRNHARVDLGAWEIPR